jgi:hypothetical protein
VWSRSPSQQLEIWFLPPTGLVNRPLYQKKRDLFDDFVMKRVKIVRIFYHWGFLSRLRSLGMTRGGLILIIKHITMILTTLFMGAGNFVIWGWQAFQILQLFTNLLDQDSGEK